MNIGSIGAGASYIPANDGKSPAFLNAQLAKYETQLADWVNCPSCKTPEGKAKISEISEKISDIKRRLASSATTRSSRPDPIYQSVPKSSSSSSISQPLDRHTSWGSASTETDFLGKSVNVYA